MKNFAYLALGFALALGVGKIAVAQTKPCSACSVRAPEVDSALAASGLALLGGTIAVLRARRRK